jgi:hypothetical protein
LPVRLTRLVPFLFFTVVFIVSLAISSFAAAPTSYRLSHPLTRMHQMPSGEMPGWHSKLWFGYELNWSNIWNAPLEVLNKSTGDTLTYEVDYEEVAAFIDIGWAFSDKWAVALEVPYSYRSGGTLDEFIDGFHVLIGSDRFLRPDYPRNENIFEVTRNGEATYSGPAHSGTGNVKLKTKFWPIQWTNDACACGFSTTAQLKIPVQDSERGLTSNSYDGSLTAHFGIPIRSQSAFWMSAGMTYLPKNEALDGWPRREWHQFYELSFDMGFTKSWGVILQLRMESPFMNKQNLEIVDDSPSNVQRTLNRVASGWNSLVHWRGSQGFGFRYRSSKTSQAQFLIVEDWAVGNFDEVGDDLYINNAPDVAFLIQGSIGF